jgi:hypothetical protein
VVDVIGREPAEHQPIRLQEYVRLHHLVGNLDRAGPHPDGSVVRAAALLTELAASVVEPATGADWNSKSTVRTDHSIWAEALRTPTQYSCVVIHLGRGDHVRRCWCGPQPPPNPQGPTTRRGAVPALEDRTGGSTPASASGAYQFLDSTWHTWAARAGYPDLYPRAYLAPPHVQDAAAAAYVQSILDQWHDIAYVPTPCWASVWRL